MTYPLDGQQISIRHASQSVQERVREWFAGVKLDVKLDGDRSVRVPHPEKQGCDLKIKGAGFRGGPVQFGTFHRTGPKLPIFDFEGRMMEDIASGHDNAYQGGASFQQATAEYRLTEILTRLGFKIVPCIGYGRIEVAGRTSWFAIYECDCAWKDVVLPIVSVDEWAEANLRYGQLLLRLALNHDLIGWCQYVSAPDGSYIIKDVHPFRFADPVNMSQLSWVMQLLFAVHIRCLAAVNVPRKAKFEHLPADMQAYPFRAVLPDATKAEHDQLRFSVVAHYMLRPPVTFECEELVTALRRNRISKALLDVCPDRFVRY